MRPSSANPSNAALIEEYYALWQKDPAAVDEKWAAFFEGFALGCAAPPRPAGTASTQAQQPAAATADAGASRLEGRVDDLVRAYRELGHTLAQLDPLGSAPPEQSLLTLEAFGLGEADLDQTVSSRFFMGGKAMRLRDLIAALQRIYTGTVGAEFMHVQSAKVRNWVRDRIEARPETPAPEPAAQRGILTHLLAAETFERFLHTRYVGQKRFSLEGGETLMPLLETILARCPALGIREIVMGMAHRGRLNVLANFLKKPVEMIFTEFSENYTPNLANGDGDVKYHLGYETTRAVGEGYGASDVEVRLASNPSHLEFVDPVVEGKARARQRILEDTAERKTVLPLLIHGDAAMIGQGIVAETLNMSQLPGYSTGGTVHLVINNQIGFTTLPADSRSSLYCTDVAKMVDAPVFHVNGDDPEAVCFVGRLAADFRQEFRRDVFIDMYCYRRYGHNEGDEPVYTQPDLYAKITKQPGVATLYRDTLVKAGRVTAEDAAALLKGYEDTCEAALAAVKARAAGQTTADAKTPFAGSNAVFQPPYSHAPVDTAITPETLEKVARAVSHSPDEIKLLPKLKRTLLDRRQQVFEAGGPYDWSFAEALAFGSLLLDGKPVRLSGQDSRRGTFSQRMSVLYDMETAERYIPLNNLAEGQARFCVYNSPLSEAAVLGFDYGYSLDYPEMLCIWEAQFGDFMNGAQTIIDQFIVSSESKWQRPSGIVILLPHGYEGQGPEHSSGRVERFLQSCAEDNIQVCNVTTPAQYFHLLRRQMMRPFRKPLVIMTPKSLLRSDLAVSHNDDFTRARFSEVLETPAPAGAARAKRVILCSGKVYYDLLKARDANQDRRHGAGAGRAALPAQHGNAARRACPLRGRGKLGVVPGGVAEHGRVEFHRAAVGGTAPGGPPARVRGPQGERQPGGRREDPPRPRAEAARGRSVRELGFLCMNPDLPAIAELRRLDAPAVTPQALAWHRGTLWISSRDARRLYGVNPQTWSGRRGNADAGHPLGRGGGGRRKVYFVSGEGADDDRYLRRYEPGRGFDEAYRVAVPDFTGSYVSFDGHNLYMSQWYKHRILQLDRESGAIQRTIQVPAEICGHTFVDGKLYVLCGTEEDGESWHVARLDPREDTPQVEALARVPFACRSLVFDGENFWTNHRAQNQTVSFALPKWLPTRLLRESTATTST